MTRKELFERVNNSVVVESKRLHSSEARMQEIMLTDTGEIVKALRSYDTIVAVEFNGVLLVLNWWDYVDRYDLHDRKFTKQSTTTASQIYKYYEEYSTCERMVFLYERSDRVLYRNAFMGRKAEKKAFRMYEMEDYELLIDIVMEDKAYMLR